MKIKEPKGKKPKKMAIEEEKKMLSNYNSAVIIPKLLQVNVNMDPRENACIASVLSRNRNRRGKWRRRRMILNTVIMVIRECVKTVSNTSSQKIPTQRSKMTIKNVHFLLVSYVPVTDLCKHGPNAMCSHCMYLDKI